MLGRYKAVIFDLDGTLVTLPVDWDAVRQDLREYFKTTDAFLPLFKVLESKIRRKPEARPRLFQLIDNYEVAAASKSRLLVGVFDLFKFLAGRAKLVLVTMQGRMVCSQLLEMHGLARFLEFSLTREDSLDRSVQLGIALDRLATGSRDTLFVGDRVNDLNSGKQAGVQVALVSRRKVELPKEDSQFESMMGLLDYFVDASK